MMIPLRINEQRVRPRPPALATRRPSSRAQSAVELALMLPALLLILVAASDFARGFYLAIEVNNAARAGVQYGVQNPATGVDFAGMKQAALNDAPNLSGMTASASEYCQCSGGTFSCSLGLQCQDQKTYVEVDTSATFNMLLNYPGFPPTVTVNGKAVMRLQ